MKMEAKVNNGVVEVTSDLVVGSWGRLVGLSVDDWGVVVRVYAV